MSVVAAIAPKLDQAEIERSKRKPTEKLDAYDYYLRGLAVVEGATKDDNEVALRLFYRAIEIDANDLQAMQHLGEAAGHEEDEPGGFQPTLPEDGSKMHLTSAKRFQVSGGRSWQRSQNGYPGWKEPA